MPSSPTPFSAASSDASAAADDHGSFRFEIIPLNPEWTGGKPGIHILPQTLPVSPFGKAPAPLPPIQPETIHHASAELRRRVEHSAGANRVVVVRGDLCIQAYVAAEIRPAPDLLVFEEPSLAALTIGADKWLGEVARCLVLNARDENGQLLDEMDVLARMTLPDAHWSVAAAEDVASCRRILLRETQRATLSADAGSLLPGYFLGMDWVGLREQRNVAQAVTEKALFRHYGIGNPAFADTLEHEFCTRFQSPFALAVSSCSAALNCAVHAIEAGPGDEVILPAFSWFSCYNAIKLNGASPVFCEIDGSLNLDPADFERRITPRTKAAIVVHYQGGPARMDEILRIARAHDIAIIEDCAQAIGANYRGQHVGTIGDIGVFSFQANKILCSGEGGMLVCRHQAAFERAVRFHDLGFMRRTFERQLPGAVTVLAYPGNQYRMSEATAGIALAQLTRLDWIIERCRGTWSSLRERLNRLLPDVAYRVTGWDAGDVGITLFLDCGTRTRAKAVAQNLTKRGVKPSASSGMVNLLTVDYVARQPDTPTLAGMPATAEWLARTLPVPIGPRYLPQHVDLLAEAIAGAWHESHEQR